MKYIVTGAAGFIGSNLVKGLNARGEEDILLVDHLGTTDKWKNLNGLKYANYMEKDTFLMTLGDLGLPDDLEAVFHLGACSATTERDASYLVMNNFEWTRQLCTACQEVGARFIYASSAATYGDGAKGYVDDLDEIDSLRPLNMYGYSKHMFDLWAKREGYFDSIVGLKYFNVYGPGEDHKGDMRSVIHKSWGQIRETGEVKLFKSNVPEYGDGEQERDFIFVKDAVAVTLFFMDHPEVSGLFNCGTGIPRNWNDLVSATFRAMDLEPNIKYIEMPEHLKGKYQNYTCADATNLHAAGYKNPFYSLEEAVGEYVRNYLQKID